MKSRYILLISYMILSQIGYAQSHLLSNQSEGSFGHIQLSSEISEDKKISVTINPSLDIQPMNLCTNCSGYLEKNPVVTIHWKGSTERLKVQYLPENKDDGSILLVKTPEGLWLFNDKPEYLENSTVIYLSGLEEGVFKIWAGALNENKEVKGTIVISEQEIEMLDVAEINEKLNVGFVPTSDEALAKMLEFADLKFDDYLIDLGCGDGRIVIEAAKRGVSGYGVDLDPRRIEDSWKNAKNAGVEELVNFEVMDLFDLDFSEATVLTMYLLEEINLKLRPKLFEQLKPGTRVVSNSFSMGEWHADKTWGLDCGYVYLWIIPAKAEGKWQWEINNNKYEAEITQTFQKIKVQLTENGSPLQAMESKLNGEKITILAKNPKSGNIIKFEGAIKNDIISGNSETLEGGNRTTLNWIGNRINAK